MNQASSNISQKQDVNDHKFICLIHNKPAIFCLNQFCHESRLLCLKCLQEGKHNHQQNIHYFSEMLEFLEKRKPQVLSVIEQLNEIASLIMILQKEFKSKYEISEEDVLQMNNNQLNSYLEHMIKNEQEVNLLLKSLKCSFNSFSETIQQSSETLGLDQTAYSWSNLRQNQKDKNIIIYESIEKPDQTMLNNNDIKQPLILILSIEDQEQQFLMKLLFQKIQSQLNYPLQIAHNEVYFNFAFTTQFPDFYDQIERDKYITQLQKIFCDFQNQISSILLPINMENINIMSKKLLSMIKWIRKFKEIIILVIIIQGIIDENLINNIKQAMVKLQLKDILFLNENSQSNQLFEILTKHSFHIIENGYKLDFQDTIFQQTILNDKQ
ncbi:unnamed protein product [Paramecium pentaurelia]|uniref:Uncharacterized protein n=1 Tax=Paramecium pentaurelia TaxID=43138 RepID=A0A8S1YFW2_9CILI|nr:unnamed protein product [Paramecium pentaurelia]